MRYIIYLYIVFFLISILANSILWLRAKSNLLLLVYEILAAVYLISVTLIYFTPVWLDAVNIWFCVLIIPIVIFDVYMTVWGKDEWVCPSGFNYSKKELELARIASVIFVAPAYISGTLLFIHKYMQVQSG